MAAEFTLTTQGYKYFVTGIPCSIWVSGNSLASIRNTGQVSLCSSLANGTGVVLPGEDFAFPGPHKHLLCFHEVHEGKCSVVRGPTIDLTRHSRYGWKGTFTKDNFTTTVSMTNIAYTVAGEKYFNIRTLNGKPLGTLQYFDVRMIDRRYQSHLHTYPFFYQ